MTTISTNDKRGTINEGVNLNQARDFSDLGAGNIYGYSFIDNKDFLQVSFSGGKTFLSRGWVFVKYNKSNEPFTGDNNDEGHRMKCELTANTIGQTLSGEGYLYVEVVAGLTDTGSTQFDGKDYFDIKFDTVAPTVGPHIGLLYKINGTTGTIIEDYRKYRVGKFESLDVKTITLNGSDLTTTINTINSDISTILSGNVPALNISQSFTAGYNAIKGDIIRRGVGNIQTGFGLNSVGPFSNETIVGTSYQNITRASNFSLLNVVRQFAENFGGGTVTCELRTVGGTVLATSNTVSVTSTSYNAYTFLFTTNPILTASTTYRIYFISTGTVLNRYGSSTLLGGSNYGGDMDISINGLDFISEDINKFYKASGTIGSTNPTTYENILGVLIADTTIDTVGNIVRYGLVKNVYTGLTSGKSYFLQSNGFIGLIPSDSLIKIGDSISSTELYIYTSLGKEEDKVTYGTTQTAFDSGATQYFGGHMGQSYIRALGIKTNKQGAYRISCITGVESGNNNQSSVKLYINNIFIQQIDLAFGFTVGTLITFNDIYINNGDIIELYTKNIQATFPGNNERSWVKNLKLTYDNFTTAYIA